MARISDHLLQDFVAGRLSMVVAQAITDCAEHDEELRARISAMRNTVHTQPGAGGKPATPDAPGGSGRGLHKYILTAVLGLLAGFVLAHATPEFGDANTIEQASSLVLARGVVDPATNLHRALEYFDDDDARPAPPRRVGHITPLATFRTAAGGYCREFETRLATDLDQAGIACRTDKGNWRLELLVGLGRRAAPGATYVPASGPAEGVLTQTKEAMKSGPALAREKVHRLIARNWHEQRGHE